MFGLAVCLKGQIDPNSNCVATSFWGNQWIEGWRKKVGRKRENRSPMQTYGKNWMAIQKDIDSLV